MYILYMLYLYYDSVLHCAEYTPGVIKCYFANPPRVRHILLMVDRSVARQQRHEICRSIGRPIYLVKFEMHCQLVCTCADTHAHAHTLLNTVNASSGPSVN